MEKEKLIKIVEDDDLGLLDIKKKTSSAGTEDDRLLDSFNEINHFIAENNREPEPNPTNIHEYKLYKRLESLRQNKTKSESLAEIDEHGLLKDVKPIENINDVFNDDDLGILNGDAEDIFELKNVPDRKALPEYVAQRKPCKEFDKFEYLFKACHEDLRNGKRKLLQFSKGDQIDEGSFFVLSGVLVYVQHVGTKKVDKFGKIDARLRCIFENGTESDLLLRSLGKGLYKDGRRVSESEDKIREVFDVVEGDVSTGHVYVLKSLSDREDIKSIKDLYKIGFSTVSVKERIKLASTDPTYLMAPVQVVTTFHCYNLNPNKLEELTHRFFHKTCVEFDVIDGDGKQHKPREWFIAPLKVIEQVVTLLINGEIINYEYDHLNQKIVLRNN